VEGKLAPEGVSQFQVRGRFTIHGATHEISLPVEVRVAGGRMTATARFPVPYVEWGMKDPSTLFLRVDKKVNLVIESTAPAAATASR
jgi:hypothetical protein